MQKSIAIIQSNYIPWKGYFDLMNLADELVLYDDCQYTKNDWRNRNLVKTAHGLKWLTIPVAHHDQQQTIYETLASSDIWRKKHWATLSQAYAKSSYFDTYREVFEPLYLDSSERNLSRINESFLKAVAQILGISTTIRHSREFNLEGGRTQRLMQICEALGATKYISGPAAQSYFDIDLAASHDVAVQWMDYSKYPQYPQLHPPFEHGVSVVDLIFNCGPSAIDYLVPGN